MTQESPSRDQDKFMVRMPEGMRDRIAEAAKANGRSMNAEIVARLSQESASPEEIQRLQTALDATNRALSHSEGVVMLIAFYLRAFADRPPSDGRDAAALLQHVKEFANALYHGNSEDSIPSAEKVFKLGVKLGILDDEILKESLKDRSD